MKPLTETLNKKNIGKRILDLSLITLSAPLWVPVFGMFSIWIKLVSKGPIFFRQERVGYRQNPFTMFKFRTMHEGTSTTVHEEHVSKLIESGQKMQKLDDNDNRLIRGGKLIRATGLDELPQFINVVRGEMSIVGPRPCTPKELEMYPKNFKKRLDGIPGITGNWQINGKNMTTFKRMVALDVLYLRKASLSFDLSIILRTIPSIIFQMITHKRRVLQVNWFRIKAPVL